MQTGMDQTFCLPRFFIISHRCTVATSGDRTYNPLLQRLNATFDNVLPDDLSPPGSWAPLPWWC